MKRATRIIGIVILAVVTMNGESPSARAGRMGGPMSSVATAPAYESVYFDVVFVANQSAVVSVNGNGSTILALFVYDADGHITAGSGNWDRQGAVVNVYRTGSFRVEVRNLGQAPNTFTLNTN